MANKRKKVSTKESKNFINNLFKNKSKEIPEEQLALENEHVYILSVFSTVDVLMKHYSDLILILESVKNYDPGVVLNDDWKAAWFFCTFFNPILAHPFDLSLVDIINEKYQNPLGIEDVEKRSESTKKQESSLEQRVNIGNSINSMVKMIDHLVHKKPISDPKPEGSEDDDHGSTEEQLYHNQVSVAAIATTHLITHLIKCIKRMNYLGVIYDGRDIVNTTRLIKGNGEELENVPIKTIGYGRILLCILDLYIFSANKLGVTPVEWKHHFFKTNYPHHTARIYVQNTTYKEMIGHQISFLHEMIKVLAKIKTSYPEIIERHAKQSERIIPEKWVFKDGPESA